MPKRLTTTLLRLLLLGALLLSACSPAGRQAPATAARAPGVAAGAAAAEAALQDQLRAHVSYLASDALAGREVGSPGSALAERYVAASFRRSGLKPLPGQKDFFHEFPLYRRGFDAARTALTLQTPRGSEAAVPGVDFRPFSFSGTGEQSAGLVFAGYGITAPEYDYDDYRGLSVEGRFVLVLRHEPTGGGSEEFFQGARLTRHSLFTAKADNARRHGAVGMLLVTDPASAGGAEDLRLMDRYGTEASLGTGGGRGRFLALHISRSLAERLLFEGGFGLRQAQKAVDGGARPAGLASLPVHLHLRVALEERAEEVPARNVVGYLPGSDPSLREEWILLGAHHDHLGSFAGRGDTVFNGADDNASGVAAVLALARSLAAAQPAPRRSLVFATFAAEEEGLFGSRRLAEELVPAGKTVLMINLDMIGRNPDRPVRVMGEGFAPDLRELVEEANRQVGLPLEYAGTGYAENSDHAPFFERGVPFLFFYTGMHEDYHGLRDEPDRLAYDRMAVIVRLVGLIARAAAERPERPGSVVNVPWLGVTFRPHGQEAGGELAVSAVSPGSGAEGVLRVGDRIVSVDGAAVAGAESVRVSFSRVRPGQEISVGLRRQGAALEATLRRQPAGYLGVMVQRPEPPGEGRAGPAAEGVLLGQVLPGGPAERGGLLPGDLILRVAGRPVDADSLTAVLEQLGAGRTVEIELLRGREALRSTLTLGRRP